MLNTASKALSGQASWQTHKPHGEAYTKYPPIRGVAGSKRGFCPSPEKKFKFLL